MFTLEIITSNLTVATIFKMTHMHFMGSDKPVSKLRNIRPFFV